MLPTLWRHFDWRLDYLPAGGALLASRPKARYHCGWEQKAVAMLERLGSVRMRDAIVGSLLGL